MSKREKAALINIVEENKSGNKIPFAINGNHITFGDDELTLNIERHERDFENTLDICRDKFGNLVMGVIPGRAEVFVAQLHIPPREYEIIEHAAASPAVVGELATLAEVGEIGRGGEVAGAEMLAVAGLSDEMEMPQVTRNPIPFTLKRCTLTLWALV